MSRQDDKGRKRSQPGKGRKAVRLAVKLALVVKRWRAWRRGEDEIWDDDVIYGLCAVCWDPIRFDRLGAKVWYHTNRKVDYDHAAWPAPNEEAMKEYEARMRTKLQGRPLKDRNTEEGQP